MTTSVVQAVQRPMEECKWMEWYLERNIRVPIDGIVKTLAWMDWKREQK